MAHVHVRELDFLGNEVDIPDFHTVVIDAEQLGIGVVEEFDLVCGVSSNGVSANSFSSFNVPDNELIIVLTSERSQVSFIKGEGKRLDQDFVQFQSLDGLKRVEVPDDDIGLESHVCLLAGSQVLS